MIPMTTVRCDCAKLAKSTKGSRVMVLMQSPDENVIEKIDRRDIEVSAEKMRRQERLKILKRTAGMWAKRSDIPADGLEYERELRNG